MRRSFSLFFACATSTLLIGCACSDNRRPEVKKDKAKEQSSQVALIERIESEKKPAVTEAKAVVKPYKGDTIAGEVVFTKVPGGIEIVADVSGLTPGKHGFHVHEFGDCSGADGMAAGGHFNPTKSKHGGPNSLERHVGDFGNLEADETGHAHYERVDTLISLEGENSILGRSIMIHADPDDLVSQPAGASGPRIACGKIEASKNE